MSRKPWYSKGLRFECQRSGNCCRNHGSYAHVYVARGDVEAIAGFLGVGVERFLAEYCYGEDGWTLLRMDRPACPFQEASGACAIYPVRPKQCATWPFWEENLASEEVWNGPVAECCPGINRGPVHAREEVERIARETEEWYEDD